MDYEKIDKDAYDILMDYGMLTFPISPIDLCHKLCIDVYKYSSFESKSALFKIKPKKGFAINRLRKIFFNDENDNNANPECS